MKLNITQKQTLAFVALVFVVLVAVGALSYYSGRNALYMSTVSDLLSLRNEKEAALDAWVKEVQLDIATFAASPRLCDAVTALVSAAPNSASAQTAHDRVVAELLPWAGLGHHFLELCVLKAESAKVITSTDASEEGKLREDRPYFFNGLYGPYVQNPIYSLNSQTPEMYASAPIRSADGRLLGVLVGHLNLNQMNEIISRRTGVYQTDEAFLVNTSNLFVTQPRLAPDPAVLQRGIHTEAVKRCLAGESGVLLANDYRGVPVVKAYRWLPEHQLGLFTKIDQAEAFRPMHKFRNILLLISGIVFLIASAVAIGLARTITRPILILQDGVVRFGHGEHGVRLPEARGDELGVLAKEFNTMAAALSEKDAELHHHAAQLEAANKELEAFSYSVSHDLRAPLRAIVGFSRVLLEDYIDRLDEEGKRVLNIIGSNTKKMGQLIDDLLLFSRLGRQEIRRSDINMEKLAKTVFEELKLAVPERKVQIIINALFPAQGDQAMIRQVFVNLLFNSIKFTRPKETAVIEVDGRSEGDENIYAIKDNGVGFDMKYVNKLFGVFQRLHSSEEFEGTGVGLAIIQRIIHRHGGRVWAEGEVGKGATFFFTLPIKSEGR